MNTIVDVETNGANSSAIATASTPIVPDISATESKSAAAVKIALPTLKMGQAGEAVRFLQTRLQSFEYRIAFNGQFGLQTDAAVKHFQSHYGGLLVDGVVGAKTWKALCENSQLYGYSFYSEFVPTTYPYDVHMPTLQKGMQGEAVECLQRRLIAYTYRVSLDGIFGQNTQTAVESFQKRIGLKADGIVGRQTWRELGINLAP
jgi:peptidoglycan hydrolase-like protein with peptidoglycan-binding domain